ncbi:hypothetical protein Z042_00950 [Chania multitudinisentens RB-25]|uniref:Fimbrial protein n=1 Tax=Chania multitudinisentens RB-25 TaxID=1441930 RepID=W0L803_9GAMM|nr:hypothetical protein Z042_00950 [Chania multitudinisentens RB-25]
MLLISAVQAETITIGRGSGIVWEGGAFSGSLSGPLGMTRLGNVSILSIGTSEVICDFIGAQGATVSGTRGLQLAPGVILVPRMSVNGLFTRYDGSSATFAGTVGYPQNTMLMDNGKNMHKFEQLSPWCFSPEGSFTAIMDNYYSATGSRQLNYSGGWVILTDGTQTTQDNILLPPVYVGSYVVGGTTGNLSKQILPTTISLRISSVECTVATTTAIDFGAVERDDMPGAEIASLSYPLVVACEQVSDKINTNINLQFRAITGLYNNDPAKLALRQGGGYITGEMSHGVTGNADCNGTTGISFDNRQLKIGDMNNSETAKVFNQQVKWRLCSGGERLPTGPVDASAEMLVTFN